MAQVVYLKEVGQGRKGKFDDKLNRNFTRTWFAKTDNPKIDPYLIIPLCQQFLGDLNFLSFHSNNEADRQYRYPSADGAGNVVIDRSGLMDTLLLDVEVEHIDDDPIWWVLTGTWSTDADDPLRRIRDPLLRPLEIDWGSQTYEDHVQVDADSAPVVNAAGQPFKDGLKSDRSYRTLQVVRNEPFFDDLETLKFENTTNENEWNGYDVGQVKCKSITANLAFDMGRSYWKVKYTFHIKKLRKADLDMGVAWKVKLLDAGFQYINAAGILVAVTEGGRPRAEPALLDRAGGLLNGTGRTGPPPLAAPHYQIFRPYDQADFDTFPYRRLSLAAARAGIPDGAPPGPEVP